MKIVIRNVDSVSNKISGESKKVIKVIYLKNGNTIQAQTTHVTSFDNGAIIGNICSVRENNSTDFIVEFDNGYETNIPKENIEGILI